MDLALDNPWKKLNQTTSIILLQFSTLAMTPQGLPFEIWIKKTYKISFFYTGEKKNQIIKA